MWRGVSSPVFSPDGQFVVFFAASDQTLKKVPVTGGVPTTLCAARPPFGMSWAGREIVFGQGPAGIQRVSENGGQAELLVGVEKEEIAHGPQILPGADAVLFTVAMGNGELWDQAKIFVQSLKPGGARKLLVDGGSDGRYIPTGHLVYAQQGTLFAVPFDLKHLQTSGKPIAIIEGVRRVTGLTGTAQFGFSDNGSLVYVPGPVSTSSRGSNALLSIMDRNGRLDTLKVPVKIYAYPRVSPDHKHVAVATEDKDRNIWILDLANGAAPRQLTQGGANLYPTWSADGRRVAFQSDREGDPGIFWQNADGSDHAERLTRPDNGTSHIPDSWSPDGKLLAYTVIKGSDSALWILSLEDKKATVFAERQGVRMGRAMFSPDGKWLAYQSNENNPRNDQTMVQPFPSTGAKYLVADAGNPMWSPDGRELAFSTAPGRMAFVSVTTNPTFSFTPPTALTTGLRDRDPATDPRFWDFAPDGKGILGVTSVSNPETAAAASSEIRIVLNWFRELQERVPVK
jgi:serine/threonine-protein kinase